MNARSVSAGVESGTVSGLPDSILVDGPVASAVTPAAFNLLDEPWIPVIMREVRDGVEVRKVVSLREAFADCTSISRVHDTNPMVVAGVYRLLFAVMHRAKPMENDSELLNAWKAGFPVDDVLSYLERWRDRFFLLGGAHPFMQVPDLVGGQVFSWKKLSAKHNGSSSKVWFDHSFLGNGAEDASPSEVARLLLATIMMTIVTGQSSLNGEAVYTMDSPLAKSLVVIPEGRHLGETLLVNTVFQSSEEHQGDLPAWEADAMTVAQVSAANAAKRHAANNVTLPTVFKGVTHRITWLARSIKLHASPTTGLVTGVEYAAGLPYVRNPLDRDPWVGYWRNKTRPKGKVISVGNELKAVGWSVNFAAWRTLPSLIAGYSGSGGSTTPPGVMNKAFAINDSIKQVDDIVPWTITIIGQTADKAKYLDCGMVRWRPPKNVLNEIALSTLAQALDSAEHTARKLKQIERNFAERVATRPNRDAITQKIELTQAFWWNLGAYFDEFLNEYTTEIDSNALLERWRGYVRRAVGVAFGEVAVNSRGGSDFFLAWGAALNELSGVTGGVRGVKGDGVAAEEKVADKFVVFVESLVPQSKRLLRDSLKNPIGSDHRISVALGGWLKSTGGRYSDRDKAFSLAAALQTISEASLEKAHGNIGEATRRLLTVSDSPSIMDAFRRLLNASGDELPQATLVRLITIMSNRGIAPDWRMLRNDLSNWVKDHNRIKIRWAQSFSVQENNLSQRKSGTTHKVQIEVDHE